jgi:hypothetical protein
MQNILPFLSVLSCAHALITPADVAAGVARASTPYKPDRPVPQSVAAAALLPFGGNLTQMWEQAAASDAAHASLHTDCRAYMLQWEMSLRLMPERAPLRDVFDALQLNAKCGVSPPTAPPSTMYFKPLSAQEISSACVAAFYVDPTSGSDGAAGTEAAPFKTLPRGVDATRAAGPRAPGALACIVLRPGVHFLSSTMVLSAADSGLVVTALAGDASPAWVSGGVPLRNLAWTPYNISNGANVYVADVSSAPLSAMPGLNTLDASTALPPSRLFRAMYPNYDIEQFTGDLPGMSSIDAWVKAPLMEIPELYYKDLFALGLKNDSTMMEYNIYAAGHGGPCEHWDRDGDSWAYICSNNTAGGWEFIEKNFASSGQLGFPVSMKLKDPTLSAAWTMPNASSRFDWGNTPTLTSWHNQGWYQATYAVTALDAANGIFTLTADDKYPSGGWQGGRTMESCDAYNTSFAAPLCSGPWYISNVFEELDAPSEFFYDPAAKALYVFFNATSGTPPSNGFALVSPQLEVFFNISGTPAQPVSDITFAGLGFRDQRAAQLDRWIDVSGGDWAIRRAGLFHLEGTARVNITGNTFYRTDANAVMIAAFNRNASVVDNEFAFTGMSAVATVGRTVQDDGTAGEQPFGTLIAYNKVHEIGAFQLQSSAWFTSRSTLTRAEGLVVFNIPRAAINFNDAFGGGNNVTLGSIFNTCRQSGDRASPPIFERSAAALCSALLTPTLPFFFHFSSDGPMNSVRSRR